MQIALDVESVPGQTDAARQAAREGTKPPATMKLQATIDKWWREEADAAIQETYLRQSFDALHGEIVSIAAVTADGRQWVQCRPQGAREAELLLAFFAQVDRWGDEDAAAVAEGYNWPVDPYLIAHNGAFDIPFIWRRSVINGVQMPRWLPRPTARAGKDYGDTMLAWSGWGGRVSLDALARALGVPSPKAAGVDGSQVFRLWTAGEYDRIARYNAADAAATLAVWQRLQGCPA